VSTFAPTTPAAVPHPHKSLIPQWLTHLGPLGLFLVAIVDSSPVPLPIPGSTDLLLLFLVSHNDGEPWFLALCAIAGSVIGGYISWHIGRKGGQAALRRYVPARHLGRIVSWVQHRPILAVFLPAVLPPPIPLSPFVLASGALGVPFKRFLAAYGAARTLRYSLVAWLAVLYGRHVVRLWSKELDKWSTPLLYVFLAVSVAGIAVGVWQFRSQRNSPSSADPSLEPETARVD